MKRACPSTSRSEPTRPASRRSAIRRTLVVIDQADSRVDTGLRGLLTLSATEDEVDRGQQPGDREPVDRLDPAWSGKFPVAATSVAPIVAAATPVADCTGIEAECIAVGRTIDDRGKHVETIVRAIGHKIFVIESDGAPLLDHRCGRPSYRLDPLRQLLGVAHRRR